MTLSGEGKPGQSKPPKDPIGQLMGNLEKNLGDIIYKSVACKGQVVDKISMFGIYFLPECDKCTVFQATFQWNTPTKIVKVKAPMKINDAVNRVFYVMSKFCGMLS